MYYLLELLFMILLLHLSCPGMSVGMVNHSTLPVCFFDLLLICILVHSLRIKGLGKSGY